MQFFTKLNTFHCGHIISSTNEKYISDENLISVDCNLSISTNMNIFIKKYNLNTVSA